MVKSPDRSRTLELLSHILIRSRKGTMDNIEIIPFQPAYIGKKNCFKHILTSIAEHTLQKNFIIIITDLHGFVKYVIIRTVFAVFEAASYKTERES